MASTPLGDLSISEGVRHGIIDSEIDDNVVDNALSSANPFVAINPIALTA